MLASALGHPQPTPKTDCAISLTLAAERVVVGGRRALHGEPVEMAGGSFTFSFMSDISRPSQVQAAVVVAARCVEWLARSSSSCFFGLFSPALLSPVSMAVVDCE